MAIQQKSALTLRYPSMASFQLQSSEVLARLKPFGITFEKSLSDLIKGIRAHSKESPESLLAFLDTAIEECKSELATTGLEVKATAVLKLAYLEMYGFDMSWSNFRILEVMSSAKFQQKRIGYLASMQSFKNEQDLLILATNQFKKDLNSHNHIEIGLALSGIATIVTPALAKDIVDDVVMKLTHSKPYIRKKAVLALYKVFLQYPESLRSCLPRVIEKLDDSDVSVISATITVICEISKNNPNIFLNCLPKFFSILEESTNNWLTIRILKLFQSLLKVEPRMKKRILPSIVELMKKTEATSLIYECVNCIVNGGMLSAESSKDRATVKLCIDKLMNFFETGDSNLKFVGLLALIKVVKLFPDFIHKIEGVSDVIKHCLTNKDLIIKLKALEICQYLLTDDNIADLVKTLLMQLVQDEENPNVPENIKLEITDKVLQIASTDNYSMIPNFKWYVTALKEIINLTIIPSTSEFSYSASVVSVNASRTIASKIGNEFKSLCVKVPSIRLFVLLNVVAEYITMKAPLDHCPLLMRDLYWVLGEYAESYIDEKEDVNFRAIALEQKLQLIQCIINNVIDVLIGDEIHFPISKKLLDLPEPEVLCILIQALIKLFSSIVLDYQYVYSKSGVLPADKYYHLCSLLFKLVEYLENWELHLDYEVQERSLSWLEFLRLCIESLDKSALEEVKKIQQAEVERYKTIFQKERTDLCSTHETSSGDDRDILEIESDTSSLESDENEEGNIQASWAESPDSNKNQPMNESQHLPPLLTEILPSFFNLYQLNPVSISAQKRITVPEDLDLDSLIKAAPEYCLVESESEPEVEEQEFEEEVQKVEEENNERVIAERLDRMKDDPYYITSSGKASTKTKTKLNFDEDPARYTDLPPQSIFDSLNGQVKLKKKGKGKKLKKEKVVVLVEETIDGPEGIEEALSKAIPKKKPIFSHALSLDNLDMSSPSSKAINGPNNYEYDIDLEAIRNRLAEKDDAKADKEKKKSKKKSKKSSTDKEPGKSTKNITPLSEEKSSHVEASAASNNLPQEVSEKSEKKLKKKKKKKALIIE